MNKKIFGVLASLFTAGLSVPFTYASENTSGTEPFTYANENTSGTEFMTGISNAKVTDYIDFKDECMGNVLEFLQVKKTLKAFVI